MFLSIDLGGTKTRVDIFPSLEADAALKHHHFITPASPAELFNIVKNFLNENGVIKVDALILGLPGILNKEKNTLIKTPNLSDSWININFKNLFKDTAPKVYCQNDAALAALGEVALGAGRDYDIAAYITISTGIGGAKIVRGRIVENSFGFEPGHHIIIPNGRLCSCGQNGCFKSYASGTAFKEIFHEEPKTCVNQNYWDQYAEYLGQGLINVVLFWSPEILILGGSMLNEPIYFWRPLIKYLEKNLKIVPLPQIKISTLKDDVGTLGGLIYLRNIMEV